MTITTKPKIILILFCVGGIILLIVSAAFAWISQKPAQPIDNIPNSSINNNPVNIDGSKLYRNEEWGFEFQYPKDWQILQPAFGSAVSKFNMDVVPPVRHLPDPIRINILPNDWIARVQNTFEVEKIIPSKITISGVDGLRYDHKSEGLSQIDYLFSRKTYWVVVGGKKQYEDVLNQVLSTLKFLK